MYFSSSIQAISSRRMRWAGHMPQREERSGDSMESEIWKT